MYAINFFPHAPLEGVMKVNWNATVSVSIIARNHESNVLATRNFIKTRSSSSENVRGFDNTTCSII